MAAASHYPHGESSGNMAIFWIVSFVIIAIVELNALVGDAGGGPKKLLTSIPNVIWSGSILTAVYWILLEIA